MPSLILLAAEWLWQSIRPGVTCFPAPSIKIALPCGTVMSGATCSIFPSTNNISHSAKVPFGPHVQSVASLISTALGFGYFFMRP